MVAGAGFLVEGEEVTALVVKHLATRHCCQGTHSKTQQVTQKRMMHDGERLRQLMKCELEAASAAAAAPSAASAAVAAPSAAAAAPSAASAVAAAPSAAAPSAASAVAAAPSAAAPSAAVAAAAVSSAASVAVAAVAVVSSAAVAVAVVSSAAAAAAVLVAWLMKEEAVEGERRSLVVADNLAWVW